MEANGEDLQKNLDVVGSWCDANSLIINNNNKSGVLHVRPKKELRTTQVIEEGRWLQIEREDRICQNCNLIEVEDCVHLSLGVESLV